MRRQARGKLAAWFPILALAALIGLVAVVTRGSRTGKRFILSGAYGRAPQIYLKQCAPCHGEEGLGDGKAAYLLRPRPRDFSYGKFLLVSTDNRIPTDDDLFQTISRGMPGSAMPPWAHLPEQDRRDLVRYVRALAHHGKVKRLMGQGMTRKEAEEVASYQLEIGAPLALPPEAPVSEAALRRGRQIYVDTCAKCHGQAGKGDGPENMEDDLGFKAFPRDFTKGIFKGSPEARDLAYRILGGMPGSPMPSSEFKAADDVWAIVHYVRSLIEPGGQQRVAQRRQTIAVKRIASVSGDPEQGWEQIPASYVALMPLWWRNDRVEGVDVRAAHDGRSLAIHLTWKDATCNQDQEHRDSFTDGAALQFSAEADPPFFGMGDPAGTVNIWMWKAVLDRDLTKREERPRPYPRALMDFDLAVKRPGANLAADLPGKVADRDPTFYAGWGARNLVSNPHPRSAVENLNAKGFGTLQAQGPAGQAVRGKGVWKGGVWRCVFSRELSAPGKGQIEFRPGETVRIAFAVWEGGSGDRNGQKSVTIWHDLALEH